MNRRTALFGSMILGGLLPRSLLAQAQGRRTASRSRGGTALEPVRTRRTKDDEPEQNLEPEATEEADATPPNLPGEPGQKWQKWDIRRYTSPRIPHTSTNPQKAIIEWIFRRTGTAVWHGDKIAVLSASRTQVRAYHDAETLKMVDEVVERFVQADEDILSLRVRVVRTDNTRWRYPVYSLLTPVEAGPQGQQIWTLKMSDAALVFAQMQVQGHQLIVNKEVKIINGQEFKVESTVTRGFTGGLNRETTAGLGAQPRADRLIEGVSLTLSPLLTFDADAVDADILLTTNTVRSLHRTRIIAPRQIGSNELTIDVPEVSETRLKQTVKGWPLGQTLLISAGIQPGILDDNKNGFLNLRIPGTVPTSSELLVFLDVEATARAKPARE